MTGRSVGPVSTDLPPSMPEAVAAVFSTFPDPVRVRLLAVRDLILAIAATTPGVGPLEEALRWGEPAYLTTASRSGSTIRLNATGPDGFGLYFNCKTSLVDSFRSLHPELRYAGDRAILLGVESDLPVAALGQCIGLALTYHRSKTRA